MLSLNAAERDEFLFLQKRLILFTNKKFDLYDKFKTIEDLNLTRQEDIQEGIMPIREKMYLTENIDDFCRRNNQLTREQITTIKSWRFAYSDDFFIIKHLKDKTVLITRDEEKLYGILGISGGLNDFFPKETLPILINTKLLPFKNKVVYDGFFGYHNINFGKSITRDLILAYNRIKGLKGIISKPNPNTFLSEINANKDETEIVKYYVKQSLKEELFPEEAWQLAKKGDANRFVFEQEYAKYFASYEKSSRKKCRDLKIMHYAMYRSCVIGVAETKKSLLEFCSKNYPDIAQYLYIFKA